MPKFHNDDTMPEGELPSYEDVLKEDAQRVQSSPSAPSRPPRPNRPASSSSSRPSAPIARPPKRPPRTSQPASAPGPSLPWRYPTGFYCSKCNNTGYKVKNGRSCKSCWRRFAPPNNTGSIPSITYGNGFSINPFSMGRPMYQSAPPFASPVGSSGQPLVVNPGDPRLGGVICGECRGSGRVSFLFDEDICPLCRGIGRIIT